jgi:type II secretory pathway predicted ATPase ExeA/phage tail protein X
VYRNFYNLHEKPFDLTPSPRFLYLGESHKEALALLTYGVVERKGFILLTGEVGTGKTTMVHALLSNLDDSVQYISISNPLLSPEDFIDYLSFSAFKNRAHFKSKTAFLFEFEEFLRKCLNQQKNVILIIDEAHRLSFDLLEEIRLLSNMELADEKLINIFLIGQPELNEKLSDPRCRALLQRISSRYHIPPLGLKDVGAYMANRLKIAGAREGDEIFSKNAIKAIHQYSGGYPRMINILADNALLLGYSKEKRKITAGIIKQCSDDLNLDGSFLKKTREPTETPETNKVERSNVHRYWKWAGIIFFVIAILIVGVSKIAQHSDSVSLRRQAPVEDVMKKQALAEKERALAEKERGLVEKERILAKKEKSLGEKNSPDQDTAEEKGPRIIKKIEEQSVSDHVVQPKTVKEKEIVSPETDKTLFTHIIVKEGDTLAQLSAHIYGRVNDRILSLVKENNPDIKDVDRIDVGQKIVFPSIFPPVQGSTFTVHIASFKPFEHAQTLFKELMRKGYDVYIIPAYHTQKGKVFRVTMGNFKSQQEAQDYAIEVRKKGISDYAEAMQLEMR